MGLRGERIRAAIAHLRGDGCDLTDPLVSDGVRTEDVKFYLGYLEELCGFRLTAREVVREARVMMSDGRPATTTAAADETHWTARFLAMN